MRQREVKLFAQVCRASVGANNRGPKPDSHRLGASIKVRMETRFPQHTASVLAVAVQLFPASELQIPHDATPWQCITLGVGLLTLHTSVHSACVQEVRGVRMTENVCAWV